MSGPIVERAYWDRVWGDAAALGPLDPLAAMAHPVIRTLRRFFVDAVVARVPAGASLVEVGCAHSLWLPYFARAHGFRVAGLDYSEIGCRLAREVLDAAGVSGEITCGDLFSPPESLLGRFDAVLSIGLVEHFRDTAGVIGALARLAAPGGHVVTIIPNMTGAVGLAQRLMNRPVWDLHVPLDVADLHRAHEAAGLEVRDAGFLVTTNFSVVNLNGLRPSGPSWYIKRALLRGLKAFSSALLAVEARVGPFRAGRWLGAYVQCVARRPGGTGGA